MKKYSMLCGGLVVMAFDIYGIIIASIVEPVSFAMVITASITLLLILYIEIFKQRIMM